MADVNDWGAPISVALTAASVHDSQVAIPLMKLSSDRVDYLYDLMDAAYDAKEIDAVSRLDFGRSRTERGQGPQQRKGQPRQDPCRSEAKERAAIG
jgi:hypothetical protein